jgi:4-amino-4-deoxy-L-arabinose transferase-like glycosyltransferase
LLLLALLVAAALRFWQLGQAPPGLYRDEAYNGLDALRVLEGQYAPYIAASNSREAAYIYLTAVAVALFGRTALALRLAAAIVGTLTTLVAYRLARTWFGQRVALCAAWLWAVTLWPVHLSRIGLRPILLAPLLALALWLGTVAYRRQRTRLWLAAGAAYGAAFYTYLAVRFTPLLLLALLSYLLLTRRLLPSTRPARPRRRLWPGILWFAMAALLVVLPLALYAWQHPSLFLGRAQQVSILNPDVRQGPLLPALLGQTGRALGMFVWHGDTILRHNPGGRPLFDLTMAAPFLLGLLWCLRHWRRPPAMALLLWMGVMLGPTVLAEDAPHFLRAAGILPAVVFLPAIGLSNIWEWPKLADALRKGLVLFLALGTLIATVADYVDYSRRPETAFFFEAAARELAQQIDDEPHRAAVYVDRRFWEGWPSLPFLVQRPQQVTLFTTATGLPEAPGAPAGIYAWPYDGLDAVAAAVKPPALVAVEEGALAGGDLETDP